MAVVLLAVGGLAVILVARVVSFRTRLGAPLLLVLTGLAVSLAPIVPGIKLEPEWVLAGILPPLLYASAMRLPLVDFRRDLPLIGGFSIVLVLVTAVLVGLVIHAVYPRLPFNLAIALGAVISPTDAAATVIIRRAGAPARVAGVLDGESLFNDATALVILRTAIAGAASFWGVAWDFAWSAGVAVAVGGLSGWLALHLGARLRDPVAYTLFSFLVPFVAYLPVEHLGASGLVAVVVAGLVAGQGGHQYISARNRLAGHATWETVETLAEGAVFLAMGLQAFGLFEEFLAEHDNVAGALATAGIALVVLLVVRGVFSTVAVALPRLAGRPGGRTKPTTVPGRRKPPAAPSHDRADQAHQADQTYQTGQAQRADQADRLNWKDGAVLEWAGLRGVVTLAAAQTLPLDAPERPAVVLIAFTVATASLLIQGFSLPSLLRRLRLTTQDPAVLARRRLELRQALAHTARDFLEQEGPNLRRPDGSTYERRSLGLALSTAPWVTVPEIDQPVETTPQLVGTRRAELRELRLLTVQAMRRALLVGQATGPHFPSSVVEEAFNDLDQEEVGLDGS
ncbi:MAG: cation:proton antiporter [Bifidobacteriaceae bacterium]|jgi:CPA1 family monovalent cation:H+ antiporter|nr:cation:proton antiporter [Bifidobacteriaceae bacterium]